MMKTIAALASVAAVASAQCTVNPDFNNAIAGTSTSTSYSITYQGTAVEYEVVAVDQPADGIAIGGTDELLGTTGLVAFSSGLDGNNAAAAAPGEAYDPVNYEMRSFTVADGGCFNLANGGVVIQDIDHDHDDQDSNDNDNYHDAVSVMFTLSNGDMVQAVPEQITATNAPYAFSTMTQTGEPVGSSSTGLAIGTAFGDGQYAANNVGYDNLDICNDPAFCDYPFYNGNNAAIFKAPTDAEVTGIHIKYWNSYPDDMPETEANLNEARIMGVGLLDNAPNCAAPATCAGTVVDGVLCDQGDVDCECACIEFPQCDNNCDSATQSATLGQCPTAEDCDCPCTDFPQCNDNCDPLTQTSTIAQCPSETECECACTDIVFPECSDNCDPDNQEATIEQCPTADECECVCTDINPECMTVTAECGAASAEGTTTTQKCICLEFEEEDTMGGGGAGGL